ncbi:MAG: hypothetical protein AB7U41_01560, partial [Dongiaceae bacterium]
MNLRLLPFLIIVCALVLGLRINMIYAASQEIGKEADKAKTEAAAPKDGEKKEAKAEDKKSEEAKDGKEEAKPAAAKKPEEHDPV